MGRINWGMKKRIFGNMCGRWGIASLFFGLWILFLCLSVAGREEDPPVLSVRREEGTGRIGIYGNLHSLTGDFPSAILLEVEAPDGGRWQAVTAEEGAEGLILTHGDLGEKTVRILLDGVCEGNSDSPLLWLWLDCPLGLGEGVTVTGEGGGELLLYVLRDGGRIEKIPLSVVWEGDEAIVETAETPSTPETTYTPETVEKAETEGAVLPPDTEEPPPTDSTPFPTATFLGCRETGVGEGMYAVQFLFGEEGGGTPILCMEGGGALYLSCGIMEGLAGERGAEVRRFCTVQGLSADRKYVFWVGTEDGWVTVTYEGGIFGGFGTVR